MRVSPAFRGYKLAVRVTSDPTPDEVRDLGTLLELPDHVLCTDELVEQARNKTMAVLIASAQPAHNAPFSVVGSLIGPMYMGDAEDCDPDLVGERVCEIQEFLADNVAVPPDEVRLALLNALIVSRDRIGIDVIRAVVNREDEGFLAMLGSLGFRPGKRTKRRVSMLHWD